jgi:hypothetical protein
MLSRRDRYELRTVISGKRKTTRYSPGSYDQSGVPALLACVPTGRRHRLFDRRIFGVGCTIEIEPKPL